MITQNINVTITGGTAPYSYVFSSSVPCVQFTPMTGSVATNVISNVEITYDTQVCVDNAVLTVTIIDANGCQAQASVPVTTTCDDLTVLPITFTPPYTFSAAVTHPSCGTSTINWQYDTVTFEEDSLTNTNMTSTLTLKLKSGATSIPVNTPIVANVTSCFGCQASQTYLFSLCQPVASNFSLPMSCVDNFFQSALTAPPQPTGCSGVTIDWSTIQFQALANFIVVRNNPATGQLYPNGGFQVYTPVTTTPGLYSIGYTVKTTDGVTSTQGTISLIVVPCGEQLELFIPNYVTTIDCDTQEAGDILSIPLADKIVTGGSVVIDWNTFTILGSPAPIATTIVLRQDLLGNYFIDYTIPTLGPSVLVDSFQWYVCSTSGYCAGAGVYTVNLQCADAPTTFPDEFCASCSEPVVMDVLTNDVPTGSPLQPSTVTVVTAPTKGVISNPLDGTLIYTALLGQVGTDTFTYTVTNLAGITSEPETVDIEITCAGEDAVLSVCN